MEDNVMELLARWQDGDTRAAAELYDRNRDRVLHLALALLGNREDAEEVMQDTFHYALTNAGRYDESRASFATWLWSIAVSRCRMQQRQRRLSVTSLPAWQVESRARDAAAATPERQMIRSEVQGRVWQAVQRLSPKLREALVLKYWGGCTYVEMAEILRCPQGTAKSRVCRALQRMRKESALDGAEIEEIAR
jgi:RNA polymerase sigma-70 factor (ECF subfamily)